MNPLTDRERFERVLRWMTTNLEVSSSVYHTDDGAVAVLPISIDADGNALHQDMPQPANPRWQLTSPAALIACCYIDALGKVITKNVPAPTNPNLERFRAFVEAHMEDFVAECRTKGGDHNVEMLYGRFRCGFAHQFADRAAHWGREGRNQSYWYTRDGELALNVDRLVRGVIEGIKDFRDKFPADARYGPDPYANFSVWLLGA